MKKTAVIDIGSNSVRLMFLADGKVLYKTLATTRLGEGLAESPRLKAEALERSALAVARFCEQAQKEGAEETYAFATAAVRSAENGYEFVARVKNLCGVEVEVIPGEKEAEIGILGALGKKDGGVIDVGGASTEIVIKTNGEIVYKKSVDIGIVRLKDTCGKDKRSLVERAKRAAQAFGKLPFTPVFYAIGGTATTLAALKWGMEVYQSEKITGTEITAREMRETSDSLLALTTEETASLAGIPVGRADVIAGGATLLAVLMEKLGLEKFIVSDRDNLEGYAIWKGLTVL